MPDLNAPTLPVLPLGTGVVLPSMVVSILLETPEARAGAEAAIDGRVLVVPKVEGRYARIGTIARIEDRGTLPNGQPAVMVRALQRAVLGAGVPGSGSALWLQVEPVTEPPATERARTLAKEYRAVVESILEHRRAPQVVAALRNIEEPGAMADSAGYSPDLSLERKVEILETIDVEARLEKVLEWAKETLADITLKERINRDVAEGME
ncbi:MAG TPA: LON peptidase substrate-binding domain-containing protein, partial [Acidimicrobiales bacterium]|nr:LON peptidase substrate-binding domain-containing protein [Acidimicrobiales bacterium]